MKLKDAIYSILTEINANSELGDLKVMRLNEYIDRLYSEIENNSKELDNITGLTEEQIHNEIGYESCAHDLLDLEAEEDK